MQIEQVPKVASTDLIKREISIPMPHPRAMPAPAVSVVGLTPTAVVYRTPKILQKSAYGKFPRATR